MRGAGGGTPSRNLVLKAEPTTRVELVPGERMERVGFTRVSSRRGRVVPEEEEAAAEQPALPLLLLPPGRG